jgi:hypothetical protein
MDSISAKQSMRTICKGTYDVWNLLLTAG